jgi:hypothetical protein
MNKLQSTFLKDVENFTGKLFNRKDDLKIIIEAFNSHDRIEDFEKLTFTGKYVNGLFRVLKSSVKIPEVESVDHIKKDLSENMERVILQLKEITFKMNAGDKKKIEDNYLQLSQNSLLNFQQLVEDLDTIKKYLNHLKRKDSN